MRQLEPGTVVVRRIRLAQGPEAVMAGRTVLTAAECARADRYRFEAPRRRFTLTRAALRHELAAYLDIVPGEVVLAAGPHGKPWLPDAPWLHFNVSHSHDEALCAVTTQGPLGIDIEHIRPVREAAAIARTKFAPEEFALWSALPVDQQVAAFFACWSRKEAFIKATGEGLHRSLADFIVTMQPGEPARLLAIHSDPQAVADWSFAPLPAIPGYASALLISGPMPQVTWLDGSAT